jgi:hypothetical protein
MESTRQATWRIEINITIVLLGKEAGEAEGGECRGTRWKAETIHSPSFRLDTVTKPIERGSKRSENVESAGKEEERKEGERACSG